LFEECKEKSQVENKKKRHLWWLPERKKDRKSRPSIDDRSQTWLNKNFGHLNQSKGVQVIKSTGSEGHGFCRGGGQ